MNWHHRLFNHCNDVCVGDITNAKTVEWWDYKRAIILIKESEPSDFLNREKDIVLASKERKLILKIKTPYNEGLQYLKDATYRRKYEPRKTKIT